MAQRSVVPKLKKVRLPYSDIGDFAVSATSGVVTAQIFRLGSIQDPDFSGTGHQPLGHDQWSAFYHHYQVESVKWKVTCSADNPSSQRVVSVYVSPSSSVSSAVTTVLEQPNAKAGFVPSDRGAPALVKQGTFNMAKWLGVKDIREYDNTRASFGANPSEDAYLILALAPMFSGSTGNLNWLVELEYNVWLSEPTALASS